jgi:Cupredoxin-like domain
MRKGCLGIAIVMLLCLAACGGASGTPLPSVAVHVVVRDDKFDPNLLTGKVNQPIALTVENQGTKPHSFVIDELKVKIPPIEPGKTGTATVLSQQIHTYTNGGAYLFYSDVAGDKDAGLSGNLSINP